MQRYAKSGLYSIVAGDVTYINSDEGKGIGPAPSRPNPSSARPSSLRGPSGMRRCRHTVTRTVERWGDWANQSRDRQD